MIESEHDNLTPDKGPACPARTNDILDLLVHGGTFTLGRKSDGMIWQVVGVR